MHHSREVQLSLRKKPAERSSQEKPKRQIAARQLWVTSENRYELLGTRILLLVVVLEVGSSVLVPRLSAPLRVEVSFLPHLLMALVALVLVLNLRQSSQRKSLRDVSKALLDSIAYIDRLEEYSFIDPETHTFNPSYLDHLLRQESQLSNRNGSMTALCLFEVQSDGQKSPGGDAVYSAASILRSNFRGSDYIVRLATDQFLVLLSDTNEQQAKVALKRLTEKVEYWDLESEKTSILLRHRMCTCPPGEDLWENLRTLQEKLEIDPAPWSAPAQMAESLSIQGQSVN
jgi:diguanylate cyclase (GGDEF)-like protein